MDANTRKWMLKLERDARALKKLRLKLGNGRQVTKPTHFITFIHLVLRIHLF